jgi:hypothetical protein
LGREIDSRRAPPQLDLLGLFQVITAASVYLAAHRLLGPQLALSVLVIIGLILTVSFSLRGYGDFVLLFTPVVIWTLFVVLIRPMGMLIDGEEGALYILGSVMLGMAWMIIASIFAIVRFFRRRDSLAWRIVLVVANCSWLLPLGVYICWALRAAE